MTILDLYIYIISESFLSPGETQTLLLNEPKWLQESVYQYVSLENSSEVQLSR